MQDFNRMYPDFTNALNIKILDIANSKLFSRDMYNVHVSINGYVYLFVYKNNDKLVRVIEDFLSQENILPTFSKLIANHVTKKFNEKLMEETI